MERNPGTDACGNAGCSAGTGRNATSSGEDVRQDLSAWPRRHPALRARDLPGFAVRGRRAVLASPCPTSCGEQMGALGWCRVVRVPTRFLDVLCIPMYLQR